MSYFQKTREINMVKSYFCQKRIFGFPESAEKWIKGKHSLIRGVPIQIFSAGARNFTKYVFFHIQFSGLVQNTQNYCAISVKLPKKKRYFTLLN